MQPFIRIGGLTFASYGILMSVALFAGYYLFAAELRRRKFFTPSPPLIMAILAAGALLFSRLYFLISSPLSHRTGYTFYGAALGDICVLALLARHFKVQLAILLDALASPLAAGYAIGRLGCFFAGDGDYGVATDLPWGMSFPRGLVPTLQSVHPTPLYEFAASAALCLWLWQLGNPARSARRRAGYVFAMYLICSGAARFSVEFIKLNPRDFFGLANAQFVALLSIAAAAIFLAIPPKPSAGPHSLIRENQ
jgi:phosphatidylglycerol---prolipoprotein diacylglyceryl transferase